MRGWCTNREAVVISGRLLTLGKMVAEGGLHDWRDRKVREWSLLLLRFAVTREPSDQSAVLAMAEELDALGVRWRPAAPRFFLRTSTEVCEAILAVSEGHNNAVLRRHIARIDDPRLRRTFQAAVGLRQASDVQRTSEPQQQNAKAKRRKDQDLWKGLPKK
jgi:hypothetical protein